MDTLIFDTGPEEESQENEFSDDEDEEREFMRGYSEGGKVITCEECGIAIRGKPLIKKIEGEEYKFCSPECAQDFEEGMG